MSKKTKTYTLLAIMFSLIAILFAVLHALNVIKNLDSYLVMTYMSYFLGLALMYLSSYHREKENYHSMYICFAVSVTLIGVAIASLIYGLCTGTIELFV